MKQQRHSIDQIIGNASSTDGTFGIVVSNAVAHLPGDFNHDGAVAAADFAWRYNRRLTR